MNSSNITIGNIVLQAAICPTCPGSFKIFPASALDSHMVHAHGEIRDRVVCASCGVEFSVANNTNATFVNVRRCPQCRHKKAKRDAKIGAKRSKFMSFTGIEKKVGIANSVGV